ncbi:hypothetical protein EJB05_41592, partial [Eragrostis curvula]
MMQRVQRLMHKLCMPLNHVIRVLISSLALVLVGTRSSRLYGCIPSRALYQTWWFTISLNLMSMNK